jgi:thiol:disulfide interchange protein DsbC
MNHWKTFAFVLLPAIAVGMEASDEPAALNTVLEQLNVATSPGELRPAPIPGFLEVVRGGQILYVSRDGRLLIDGDILSVTAEVNLTERRRAAVRRALIAAVPREQRIVVPAVEPIRARIVVFADTNCPYCLELHEQGADFAQHGIEVHYLFYPRSGPSGESFPQAVAVWCAPDRIAALGAVLGGATLPAADCDHPVMSHYELARQLDLKGTPAIVTADGDIRYGVVSAEQILDGDAHADR